MIDENTDVIQGTLDMLILKTLSLEPMHGFGIARRMEQISRGVFKINPGSLLTALQRLERAGWLDAEWRQTENSRRARFYTLTRTGRKQLEAETAEWTRRVPPQGQSRLRGRQRDHLGTRHRCEHRDLQRGESDPLRAAAVPPGRPRGHGVGRRGRSFAHRRHLLHLPRAARAEPCLRSPR